MQSQNKATTKATIRTAKGWVESYIQVIAYIAQNEELEIHKEFALYLSPNSLSNFSRQIMRVFENQELTTTLTAKISSLNKILLEIALTLPTEKKSAPSPKELTSFMNGEIRDNQRILAIVNHAIFNISMAINGIEPLLVHCPK